MQFLEAVPNGFDSVDAGENEPVVMVEIAQSGIERPIRLWFTNLNKGNLDDAGAELAQAGGKRTRLMAGAANENAKAGERFLSASRSRTGEGARPHMVFGFLHGCWGTAVPWP